MRELQVKHARGTNERDHPDRAPTGSAYQQRSAAAAAAAVVTPEPAVRVAAVPQTNQQHNNNNEDSDDDEDDDYDWLLDEDDGKDDEEEDAILGALRERRLAELKAQQQQQQRQSDGQVRTISQDEFLPTCCTAAITEYTVVHFYHDEFARCQYLDHHLKRVALQHRECQFVRMAAEKAPFFVAKLRVHTLPTVLVLRGDGHVTARLVGFEGLRLTTTTTTTVNSNSTAPPDPDAWETSALQEWLAAAGAIQYNSARRRPAVVDQPESRRGVRRGGAGRSYHDDDDDE